VKSLVGYQQVAIVFSTDGLHTSIYLIFPSLSPPSSMNCNIKVDFVNPHLMRVFGS
jgi:hypothetical protein